MIREEEEERHPYIMALKRERRIASNLCIICLFLAIVMALFSVGEHINFVLLTATAVFGGWAIGIDNALDYIKEEGQNDKKNNY